MPNRVIRVMKWRWGIDGGTAKGSGFDEALKASYSAGYLHNGVEGDIIGRIVATKSTKRIF